MPASTVAGRSNPKRIASIAPGEHETIDSTDLGEVLVALLNLGVRHCAPSLDGSFELKEHRKGCEDWRIMDERLELRGNQAGATLQVASDGDDFTVTLTADGLRAEGRGWWNTEMEEPRQLVAFFEELASCWKGWEGEKRWRALESPFYLSAIHDRLGHVTLTSRLESGWVSPTWAAETSLVLDAGSLDEVAARAARSLSPP